MPFDHVRVNADVGTVQGEKRSLNELCYAFCCECLSHAWLAVQQEYLAVAFLSHKIGFPMTFASIFRGRQLGIVLNQAFDHVAISGVHGKLCIDHRRIPLTLCDIGNVKRQPTSEVQGIAKHSTYANELLMWRQTREFISVGTKFII